MLQYHFALSSEVYFDPVESNKELFINLLVENYKIKIGSNKMHSFF